MAKKYLFFMQLIACILLLQACVPEDISGFVPEEKQLFAQQQIAKISRSNYQQFLSYLTADSRSQMKPEMLYQIQEAIPKTAPKSIELVGYNFHQLTSIKRGTQSSEVFTFQYQYPEKWLLISIAFVTQENQPTQIATFNIQYLENDLKEINKVTFLDAPITNIPFTLIAASMPFFMLGMVFLCYKTPIPKRKWVWYIFIIVGFLPLTLNWTTGGVFINPLSIQFLGSGFMWSSIYTPLTITTSIPVGALVFLIKRDKWIKMHEERKRKARIRKKQMAMKKAEEKEKLEESSNSTE